MKKILFIFLLLHFSYTISAFAQEQSNPAFETYPSWSDEFNYRGFPDQRKWTVSTDHNGVSAAKYVNKKQNVWVKHGKLNLKVYPAVNGKFKYEAGRIATRKGVGFLYGKLVIRAKGTLANGAWYALWMKAVNTTKSKYRGEIDLMEYFGNGGNKKIQTNFHLWGNFSGKKNNHIMKPKITNIDISKWHIYTMEWYKDHIICFIDNQECYYIKKGDQAEWPYNQEYMLLLANTYGFRKSVLNDNQLPTTLQVDYVRYYKLKQ